MVGTSNILDATLVQQLKEADRKLYESIVMMDKLERCGGDVVELRRFKDQLSNVIENFKREFPSDGFR